MVNVSENQEFGYLDRVTLKESPSDLGKSRGRSGFIKHIFPTARADGSVWYNYVVQLDRTHSISALQSNLESADE